MSHNSFASKRTHSINNNQRLVVTKGGVIKIFQNDNKLVKNLQPHAIFLTNTHTRLHVIKFVYYETFGRFPLQPGCISMTVEKRLIRSLWGELTWTPWVSARAGCTWIPDSLDIHQHIHTLGYHHHYQGTLVTLHGPQTVWISTKINNERK